MATINQMAPIPPGSNEFYPNKVFDPAVQATLQDLGQNPDPLSGAYMNTQANPGAIPQEQASVTGPGDVASDDLMTT